jgi:hypothetical protein
MVMGPQGENLDNLDMLYARDSHSMRLASRMAIEPSKNPTVSGLHDLCLRTAAAAHAHQVRGGTYQCGGRGMRADETGERRLCTSPSSPWVRTRKIADRVNT